MSPDERFRPPDGARLATLERRALWLSRPEIAWALPGTGALFGVDTDRTDALDLAAGTLSSSQTPLAPASLASLAPLWRALWLAPPPIGDVVAIVRWRGLFRELGEGPECDAMAAWIAAQAG